MKEYLVGLHGCDASTYIAMTLTLDEVKTVNRIVDLTEEASSYRCMPVMSIELLTDENREWLNDET